MTTPAELEHIAIYVSAGFATASNFLNDFAAAIALRYENEGKQVRVHIHFPYGAWDRSKRVQLQEIIRDMWHNAHRKASVYGGKNLYNYVVATSVPSEKLLFIGHSGGAVASIMAAERLEREGRLITAVIQIGSPKCAIPVSLKRKVLNIQGENQQNQKRDPVARLGTWGGWRKTRLGIRLWHREKHAPIHLHQLPLIGGHADYFRDHAPYIWENNTNLQTTMNTIWTWLKFIEKDVNDV
ncbi:alpha/beta hydrolase family protein [Paenibacillus roseipurpureus]|uniref:Fungal lipase-like domain-containing protein n=1 Tax=Paenibacillus roseopurpureus TaxID=2918901 RepID=A0AA96LK46_9BACL|nr:hypothetical protein [Paenibacillus sp. MBLB1832]WNR42146.1 hypothetical protein MJB10_13465 [Paenibacillus sp. MBLB1832]